MRLLHTSDWHLGHYLYGVSAEPEQGLFLRWLAQTILEERVEVLIIAGDIFDVSLPPKWAEKLYYEFLAQLPRDLSVVVIGGNHDSPHTLNAPRAILQSLNVHVRGGLEASYREHVLTLPGCVVCALPFVRESDLRRFQRGSGGLERDQWLRGAIGGAYLELQEIARRETGRGGPLVAVGHLATATGQHRDSERPLSTGYAWDLMPPGVFEGFDYVALGHLHQAQTLGGQEHVRFSGSPYALSFGEARDPKQVCLVDFAEGRRPSIRSLPVPTWRKMVSLEGTLDQVLHEIEGLGGVSMDADIRNPLGIKPFVEVKLQGLTSGPGSIAVLTHACERAGVRLLKVRKDDRTQETVGGPPRPQGSPQLMNLTPRAVFHKLCADRSITDPETLSRLMQTFEELTQCEGFDL